MNTTRAILGDLIVDEAIADEERRLLAIEREDASDENDTAVAMLDTLRGAGGELDRQTLVRLIVDRYGHGRRTVEKWLAKLVERNEIVKRKATAREKAGNKRHLVIYELPAERRHYTR